VPLAERRAALADKRNGDAIGAIAGERHRYSSNRQRRDR
jgi:hypothetical protein